MILKQSRDKALACVKSVLAIDPDWKETLQSLWDPNFPKKDPNENDLESFADDEEFRNLLN